MLVDSEDGVQPLFCPIVMQTIEKGSGTKRIYRPIRPIIQSVIYLIADWSASSYAKRPLGAKQWYVAVAEVTC